MTSHPLNCYRCRKPLPQRLSRYGLHRRCFSEWFEVDEDADFANVNRVASALDSANVEDLSSYEFWNSSFFQGNYLKYTARLGEHEYILKCQQAFAPELPVVEYLSNQIAMTVGISVPAFYLIQFYGKPCFLSRNFLNELSPPVTLNHIYHYLSGRDEYRCDKLISIIAAHTKNISQINSFIKMCLFDAFIGNHDRHGRNLGLIGQRHLVSLAPAYDNPSALGLESGSFLKASFSPRGKIATSKTMEPVMSDYAREFIDLGYAMQVEEFLKSIPLDKIKDLIRNSFCSELMKEAMMKLIFERYRELSDAISS